MKLYLENVANHDLLIAQFLGNWHAGRHDTRPARAVAEAILVWLESVEGMDSRTPKAAELAKWKELLRAATQPTEAADLVVNIKAADLKRVAVRAACWWEGTKAGIVELIADVLREAVEWRQLQIDSRCPKTPVLSDDQISQAPPSMQNDFDLDERIEVIRRKVMKFNVPRGFELHCPTNPKTRRPLHVVGAEVSRIQSALHPFIGTVKVEIDVTDEQVEFLHEIMEATGCGGSVAFMAWAQVECPSRAWRWLGEVSETA